MKGRKKLKIIGFFIVIIIIIGSVSAYYLFTFEEEKISRNANITIQIVGASLFGALSIALSALLAPIIPRIPGWGIAIIDPVSIIWVMCFLIFGSKSGILCCLIGMVGLMPFDPFSPIGPFMKFSATIALIIVPILFLKLYKEDKTKKNSQKIKNLKNYLCYVISGNNRMKNLSQRISYD